MKKIALVIAIALAVFVGMTGCDTGNNDTPGKSSAKAWSIKTSADGWKDDPKNFFVVDEIDSTKQTYKITGLYDTIAYELVLVNPDGVEFKIEGAKDTVTEVTPGTAFILGDSSPEDSTTKANAGFDATKGSYIVDIDVIKANAPSVTLTAGSDAATPVTLGDFLEKLKITGGQFSEINAVEVGGWTDTSGKVSDKTMTWDLLVDSEKDGFGFPALDGWLKGAIVDVESLVEGGEASAPIILVTTGEKNCMLNKMPNKGSVYTVVVTVDVTKSVVNGRYTMTVALKTAGTKDWKNKPWDAVFIAGTVTTWDPGAFGEATNAAGVWSYTFEAKDNAPQFKVCPKNAWGGDVGAGDILQGEGSLELSTKDNISFTAEVGKSYTIKVTFPASYVDDGKPVVTVTLAP